MEKKEKRLIWDVENFHLFGTWLLSKNVVGHGLLCIIGPAFGFKIGELLTMKWKDFIDDKGSFYGQTYLTGNEKRVRTVNSFVGTYILSAFEQLKEIRKRPNTFTLLQTFFDEHIFTYTNSGLQLSTSNLNKELKRYYELFKKEMETQYYQIPEFREPKTNAFEIAWARNFLKQYRFSKKAFITVSKELGHSSVQYTCRLLEAIPNDEIIVDSSDYNPDEERIKEINETLKSGKDGKAIFYRYKLLKYTIDEDENENEELDD
jgi:hypothetical protein